MSFQEKRELIRQLNRLNLEDVEYSYLLQKVISLLKGTPVAASKLNSTNTILRGVKYDNKPIEIASLKYPPAKKITNYQRCNAPYSPMFYGSVDLAAIFYELRGEPGDKIYISRWGIVEEFYVTYASPEPQLTPSMQNRLSEIVQTYVETIFSQKIHETFSYQYKISAAISDFLTKGEIPERNSEIGGLIYPSIAHPGRSDNLVLKPHIVDKKMSLLDVEEIQFISSSEGKVTFKRIDYANKFSNGYINWIGKGKTKSLNLKNQGEELLLSVENNAWVARDVQGNIVEPD